MTSALAAQIAFETWRDTLRSFCGNFEVDPGADLSKRHGHFGKRILGGLEMSHIATNYDGITRDRACIRRDDVDCFYLVHQISGRMGLEHRGQDIHLDPGDCVLLDSAQPMRGHYGAAGLEFATLHIPRELLLREEADHAEIEVGVPRTAAGSRGGTLNAALRHIRDSGLSAAAGQGFIVDLARLAFRADPRRHSLQRFGGAADRTVALKEMIGRNASDQGFSLSDLAELAGMSERQVQRDLQADGTSFSRELVEVRLARVERRLRAPARNGARPYVAQIAYDAGFNDLSHFNRVFRRKFGCSPREFAQMVPGE